MARASKSKKAEEQQDKPATLPPEWQKVVDASAAAVEATMRRARPEPLTGIVHENGVAYVLEPIDPVQLTKDSHELALLLKGRDKIDSDRRQVAAAFKSKLADLDERITALAEELETGLRKRPAQQELPVSHTRVVGQP